MKNLAFAILVVLALASPALAVPSLQLDISGGSYDVLSESVISASGDFTLYALLNPDGGARLSDQYYISIAVEPQLQEEADLGTFTFDGLPIQVTEDMNYGTPSIYSADELASHGAYPTYFLEYGFTFNPNNRATEYNVQDNPGGFVADPNGTLYYAAFEVTGAYLAGDYGLHFDLYNVTVNRRGIQNIKSFAPFSHDAGTSVPEPSSLLLLGIGVVGLVGLRRRMG